MPTQNEIREFEHALQRARRYVAQYEQVSSYLDEAERCFKAECYRAAIVMLWCAASARLNEDVEKLGATSFLESDRDSEMVRVCAERLGILTENRRNTLIRCLGDRNNCAHPSREAYGAPNVIGYLQDLNRALFGYQLSIDPSTFKKILLTEEYLSPKQAEFLITKLRVNRHARQLPHTLINAYFDSGARIREKIRLIWQIEEPASSEETERRRMFFHRLDLSRQEQVAIMRHLARRLREAGIDHPPTEIAQLIFWEVLSDDDASAAIYEYFISRAEHLTMHLIRKFREYAPITYRERLEAALNAS